MRRTQTRSKRLEFEGPCGVGPSEAQKIGSSGAPIKFSVVLQGEVLRGRGGVYFLLKLKELSSKISRLRISFVMQYIAHSEALW